MVASSAAAGAASIGAVRRAPASPMSSIARAVREGFWATSAPAAPSVFGKVPAPTSLPSGVIEPDRSRAASLSESSELRPEGEHGFVQLLPPPPELSEEESLPQNRDARYFELPPAPEN